MPEPTLILIALALAVDALAIAIAISITLGRVTGRQIFRIAFHFGLFQALMPLLGWLAGRTVGGLIATWDHWIAFGLLVFIGTKAIYESRHKETWTARRDPTRGWALVGLSLACSIDALAVGLSLALLGIGIWWPIVEIGLVCAGLTLLGMLVGPRLGALFGQRVERVGGLILIGIGVKILIEHLVAA